MSKGAFINYVFSIQEKGVLRFATSANIGRGFLNTVTLYILELFGTIPSHLEESVPSCGPKI